MATALIVGRLIQIQIYVGSVNVFVALEQLPQISGSLRCFVDCSQRTFKFDICIDNSINCSLVMNCAPFNFVDLRKIIGDVVSEKTIAF